MLMISCCADHHMLSHVVLTIICFQRLVPVKAAVQISGPVNAGIKARNVGGNPAKAPRGLARQSEGYLRTGQTHQGSGSVGHACECPQRQHRPKYDLPVSTIQNRC